MRPGLSRPLDRLISFPRSVRGKTVVNGRNPSILSREDP